MERSSSQNLHKFNRGDTAKELHRRTSEKVLSHRQSLSSIGAVSFSTNLGQSGGSTFSSSRRGTNTFSSSRRGASSFCISKSDKLKKQLGITKDSDEAASSSSDESDSEDEFMTEQDHRNKGLSVKEMLSDQSPECAQVEKLLKYMKWGNKTVTVLVLCLLKDFNLSRENIQSTIEQHGLELLLNLVDTDDLKCRIGAFRILKEITANIGIRKAVRDLGGLQAIVYTLKSQDKDLKCLAAETIANLGRSGQARKAVRQYGGIKRLISMIENARNKKLNQYCSEEQRKTNLRITRCCAEALASCAKSDKVKKAMRKVGVIPVLAEILTNVEDVKILIPSMNILQECASDANYRIAIRNLGLVVQLVRHVRSENLELKMHCASAIRKVCEDKESSEIIRLQKALSPLVELLQYSDSKDLLIAATGAIWKCSLTPQNADVFEKAYILDTLIGFLEMSEPEEVRINCSGAISVLAKRSHNRVIIRERNGIKKLMNQLGSTTIELLVNATDAIGTMAEDKQSIESIVNLDGIRLLWSLLKNPAWQVQASAANAMCPCLRNMEDAGEEARAYVGGLELMMDLLKSDEEEVLAATCRTVCQIAQDDENLAILTDLKVVQLLSDLTATKNDSLRIALCEAIGVCCNKKPNRRAFGDAAGGAVIHAIIQYMKAAQTERIKQAAAFALNQLSEDAKNCITMHKNGVFNILMETIGSSNESLQQNSAGCLANIRRLAMCNERARYSR